MLTLNCQTAATELFFFVCVWFKECVEVTHWKCSTLNDSHVRDVFTIFVEFGNSFDYVVEVLLCELATVDSETNNVTYFSLLFWCFEVVFHGVVTEFGCSDTVTAEKFHREALTCEGVMTTFAIEELCHVDVYTVTASWDDNAFNACVVEAFCKVVTLCNTFVEVVEVAGFFKTYSKSHHITTGHTAVRGVDSPALSGRGSRPSGRTSG